MGKKNKMKLKWAAVLLLMLILKVIPTTKSVELSRNDEVVTAEITPVASISGALVPVTRVIDGDTIKIDNDGKIETIRLIGLDTPEIVDPRKPVQCFAAEASAKAKELLTGKKVYLEVDPSQEEKDKYGRWLRYVFLEDGTNFNKMMIEQGFGHQYTYQKPYKYREDFMVAERTARAEMRGLWATNACDAFRQ